MLKAGFAFCGVLLALILGTQPVKADSEVTYQITGTYSSDTGKSLLSEASDTFTMTFTLPLQPVTTGFNVMLGDDFSVDAAVPFSVSVSNVGSASGLMFLTFYTLNALSQSGGLFVDFCADDTTCPGQEFQWVVPGPQLYSGLESSPTLFPTSFDFTGGQFLTESTSGNNIDASGTFDGSVSASVVTTPEPASVSLLAFGIFGIFAISFYQKRQSGLVRS